MTARAETSARVVLSHPALAARQRLHAWVILVTPAALSAGAVVWHRWYPPSRVDVAVATTLSVLTLLGISVGFHRHFAHRAFEAAGWLRALLAVLGCMAAQGPLIYWVSNHRRHHAFSDRALDPHSPHVPRHGRARWRAFWHAHSGWTFGHDITNSALFAKDLLGDPLVLRINAWYYAWVALGVALPVVGGGLAAWRWEGAVGGLLWGGGLRLLVTLHLTNAINSVCHMFGRRDHETGDDSRNNAWLALPTLGESWHNNHHACAWSATFSFTPRQIDLSAGAIWLLERAGAVWKVRRAGPADVPPVRNR